MNITTVRGKSINIVFKFILEHHYVICHHRHHYCQVKKKWLSNSSFLARPPPPWTSPDWHPPPSPDSACPPQPFPDSARHCAITWLHSPARHGLTLLGLCRHHLTPLAARTMALLMTRRHELTRSASVHAVVDGGGLISCWETRAAPCVQWVRACIKGLIPAHWTSGLRTDELGYGRYEPYIVVSYLRAGNARY